MSMSDVLAVVQIASSIGIVPLFSVIWGMNNRLTRLEERLMSVQRATNTFANRGVHHETD